ncbi:hypothetical protein ABPG72_006097 [Tetrahymena utriculariae]
MMKYYFQFVLLTVFTLLTLGFGQSTIINESNVCEAKQCSSLINSQVFKYIQEIKSIENDCIQNCNGFKCIVECSSNKIQNADLLRFKQCFDYECLPSTLVNNLQSLKNLLSVFSGSDCTASLRNQCQPYIDYYLQVCSIYYCPRLCLLNWVPSECTPCTYQYC